MNPTTFIPWMELFASKEPGGRKLDLRVINKNGQPFLILPKAGNMAAKSLSMYPAQTPRARLAKKVLKMALSLGLPLPMRSVSVNLSPDDPFVRFLMQLVQGKAEVPSLAILAGNPRAEGRRFLVLLFDDKAQPAFVIKAGIGPAARQLIQLENTFFQNVASGFSGLPKFRGSLVSERVEALALDYVEGESPTSEDRPLFGKLFASWLDRSRTVCVRQVPAWQALGRALGDDSAGTLLQRAGEPANFSFHPTLFHGDFAPWNIKVASQDGAWVVLDWERGERVGFPGWDWFHYVIQTGILVEKLTAEASLRRLDNLLADSLFQQYAELAGIKGRENFLVAAYLSHCIHVIQPGEGLETLEGLLTLLAKRG